MATAAHLLVLAALIQTPAHHGYVDDAVLRDRPQLGELKTVTINKIFLKGALPAPAQGLGTAKMNAVFSIKEWIRGRNYVQLREVYNHFSHDFELRAMGYPTISLHLLPANMNGDGYQYLGAHVDNLARIRPDVSYALVPLNQRQGYTWQVSGNMRIVRRTE
jgi:hypothetical protein